MDLQSLLLDFVFSFLYYDPDPITLLIAGPYFGMNSGIIPEVDMSLWEILIRFMLCCDGFRLKRWQVPNYESWYSREKKTNQNIIVMLKRRKIEIIHKIILHPHRLVTIIVLHHRLRTENVHIIIQNQLHVMI